MKKIALTIMTFSLFALFAAPVFAHGAKPAYRVDPADKNCMGQLARMHAQDEKQITKGLPDSFAVSKHGTFHDEGKGASVKTNMQGFQAYCKEVAD